MRQFYRFAFKIFGFFAISIAHISFANGQGSFSNLTLVQVNDSSRLDYFIGHIGDTVFSKALPSCCSGGPPANNNFASATPLTIGVSLTGQNTCGATIEASENLDCNSGSDQSVWYKFTATSTTTYVWISKTGGGCVAGNALWAVSSLPTGSCPHAWSCQNYFSASLKTLYQLATVVGNTYYIQVVYSSGGACGAGLCFDIVVQNSNPGGTLTNPSPGLQGAGSCSSPVAGCYLQQYAPSVATVTGSCPQYNVNLTLGQVWTSCYNFTTNNSEGSVDIQDIVQSDCGPGNVRWANWTLYSATGCNMISCGNLSNVTVSGLTCNTTYVICWSFEVPNCTHTIEYPYLSWSSASPPPCTPSAPTVTIASTNILCNPNCTGSATANTVGGSTPYTYSWSNGMTTSTITGLCAGSYTVTVTDNGGGGGGTFWTENFENSCASGCFANGFSGVNGAWSVVATGLNYDAGFYNVWYVSCAENGNAAGACGTGCGSDESLHLGSQTLGDVGAAYDAGGLCGAFWCIVTDQRAESPVINCSGKSTITLSFNYIEYGQGSTDNATLWYYNGAVWAQLIDLAKTPCCGGACNGSLQGQWTAYSIVLPASADNNANVKIGFRWVNNDDGFGTDPSFAVDDITLSTAGGGGGSSTTASVTITQPAAALSTALTSQTNVSCFGGNNGAINITVSGGTPTYSYNWGGGITTEDRTNLIAGTYTVTVTDANGCTTTRSVTITQPLDISLPYSVSNETCAGLCNGSIDLTPSGGTGAYIYSWSSGEVTQDLTNKCSGSYTVTVTDANSCTKTATATINAGTLVTSTFTYNGNQCLTGNSFNFTNTGTSGGGVTYSWTFPSGTPANSSVNNPTGVTWSAAGTYSIAHTVTSAGCSSTTNINITVYPQPSASTTVTNLNCFNVCTGAINLTPSGGTPGYVYDWADVAGASNSEDRNSICAGTYNVTVTDFYGCTAAASATVTQPAAALSATASQTDVSCNGGNNGQATANPANGTSPYTYVWNDPAPAQSTQTVTGLTAGNWTVTVTDNKGCTFTVTVTITQPAALTNSNTITNLNCFGVCTGSLTANPAGGNGGFSYSWSSGPNTQTINNLCAGSYTVTVTDSKGCTVTTTSSVTQPAVALGNSNSVTNIVCKGVCTGSITSNPIGGTLPYTYNWSSGPNTQTINNLCAGSFTVTVTDNKGCTFTTASSVTEPAAALSSSNSVTNLLCNGVCSGSITSTPSGGTGSYSYNWSNGMATATIGSLCAASYTVTVTDGNGCTFTQTSAVTQPVALTVSNSVTNLLCNAVCTGSITATPSGGTGTYTYSWSNGMNTATISSLCAASYTVTVTDGNGCTVVQSSSVTQPAAPLTIANSVTNVLCTGACTGSITATPSGGTGAYTYSWSNGMNTSTINSLCAAAYTVTVTDGNGCTAVQSSTVTQPASAVGVSNSVTNLNCFGVCTGSITATGSGGTGTYTINWSNGMNVATINSLCAGSYTVTITDNNGCTAAQTSSVTQPAAALTATMSGANITCNGLCNGNAAATVSGGTSPYTYSWNDPGFQTTSSATGLCTGTFSVTVTDNKGCTTTGSRSITQPGAVVLSTGTVNATCGNSDGQASVSVTSGGTGPFSYVWNDPPPAQSATAATGLAAGGYTVTVTDANGCTATANVTVNDAGSPTASISSSANVSCNGGNNGSATVTASGGTPAYTYSWSSGAATSNATGLIAGNYTVTVRDASGCIATANITITQPSVLNASITASTNVSCGGGNNGSITVSVSGGTVAYSYNWSPGGQTVSTATGLTANTYSVTVTDSKGCTKTQTATITQPASISISNSVTNVSCNGGSTGSITSTPSGGTSPYSFSWTGGQTNATATGLGAGTFTVTVTDNNGCTSSANSTVTQPAASLSASMGKTDASCGSNNGTATATAGGGTGPYTYSWVPTGQTTSTATGLIAGTYNVTVTDNKGCTTTGSATLNNVAAGSATAGTVANATCNGSCNGNVNVAMSGGTSPFSYLWSNGATVSSVTGLCSGAYSVTVTDALGCTATSSASVTQPTAVTASIGSVTNLTCNGNCMGQATVTPGGGTGAYSYVWNSAPAQYTITATGLCAGTFTVTVSDVNGCSATTTATLTQPAALSASTVITNAVCNGGTGNIDLSVSGGTGSYTYSWSNGAVTQDLINVAAAAYSVTVTDGNGCTVTANATITQPAALTLSTSSANATCGLSNGTATATAGGGTPVYTYSWSPTGQTTSTATGLAANSYNVTVTDSKGCSITGTATVNNAAGGTATAAVVSNATAFGVCNGQANVTMAGGTSPFTYSWSGGSTVSTATGLCAGNVCVTVSDANSCTSVSCVTITQPPAITLTIVPTNVLCKTNCTGIADLTVSGGTPNYTYLWSNAMNAQDITNLCAATYSVTVTDASGATATASVTITEPALTLSATITANNVSCSGLCDGTSAVTASGGTSPYTYIWSGGGTASNKTGLCAGAIAVTVTDANGCSITANTTITQPAVLSASTAVTNVTCNGLCDGTANVTASGGTTPYTYAWSGGGTASSKNGLCNGSYTVTVTDSKGCTATTTATVTQPTVLSATTSVTNVTCNGLCNGSANVTASGGTTPYTYSWSGGGTATSKSSLCAATYTVTVTDNKNCSVTASATVTQPVVLSVTATGGTTTCFGACNGTATASPAGGTIPYSYLWSSGGQTTATATGFCAGNFTITLTDNKSCTASASVTVNQPLAISLSVTSVNSSCGQSNGSATATPSNGVVPYSYQWSINAGSQTTSTATGLSSGTYGIAVTDANGCTATATVSVADNNGPTASLLSSSDISCFGGGNGTATVQVTDGQAPYTYLWSPSGQTNSNATGLPAGNHSVLITDVNGCNTSVNVTLTQPIVLSVSVTSSTNVTCNGLCNGSASSNVSGGTSPYTYSWSNGSTSSSATALCSSSYTVTVTDNNSCTATSSVTITQPVALSVTVTPLPATCAGLCNGSANSTGAGGTPPYAYLWTPGNQTTSSATGLCAASYTVQITDSKGCTASASGTVTQPNALTAVISSQTNVSCNGYCDGIAQVTVSQGTSPYTYSWSNGKTIPLVTGLCSGGFFVTATDANGCTVTASVTITQPAALTNTITSSNVTCSGNNNGLATANASGGSSPYSYQWDDLNLQTTSSATGLIAGTYNVTVTDAKGCSVTGTAMINEPVALTLSFSTNGSNCGQADGSATVTIASGSNPPFSYQWSVNAASQTTAAASALAAGSYNVTVTNAAGCTVSGTVAVSDLGSPSLTLTSQGDASCYGICDGFASVTVLGGTPPYTYSWNSTPPQSNASATGLCAGTFICNVVDPNNCNANISVTIGQPLQLNVVISSQTNVSCNGLCNGSANAVAAGGTSPFTYLWNDPLAQSTQSSTGLCPGTYSVIAEDANGCTASQPVTITQPATLTVSITPADAHCGQADGIATATVSGGNGSNAYSWSNSQTNPIAVNLLAGSYSVTVSDIKGCSATASTAINNISSGTAAITLLNSINCYGGNNGILAVSMAGGTSPFIYSWSNGATQSSATGLTASNYTVSVTDAFGCLSLDTFILTQPLQLVISGNGDFVNCFSDCDGRVTVNVSGGVSPLSYLWDDPLASQNIYAENLCTGTYNVTVTDNNGCSNTASAVITSPPDVTLSETHTDASCGVSNGSATVSASGGVSPYTYQWPSGQTLNAANNLSAGTYIVTVTDNSSCSKTINVVIGNPGGLTITVVSTDSVSCNGGSDGSAVISAGGGTPPYTYQWNDPLNQSSPAAGNLPAGTWIVSVTDVSGCLASATVPIFQPSPLNFNISETDPVCNGDCNGSAGVVVSGGIPPYSYQWDDPQTQTNANATGLCAGAYNLIITDAHSCIRLSNTTLYQPMQMTTFVSVTSNSCGAVCSGTATAFTSNGVSPFTYQWNDPLNQVTQTAQNLCAGNYSVTVTDNNGCSFVATGTVTQPVALSASVTSSGNCTCFGNCNGWAQANATGGTPPYTYSWTGGQASAIAVNLCSGNYEVTVTDNSGCQDVSYVSISQPMLIGGAMTYNDISCYGACDGDATLNTSGGTPPYVYQWNDIAFQTTSSATGLCPGVYNLSVTDTSGCQQAFQVQLTEPPLLTFTSSASPSSCGSSNGQACVSVAGGVYPYVITWNDPNTQVGSCAFNLPAGAYTVIIGDAGGCIVSGPVTVNDAGSASIDSVVFTDVSCYNYSDGSAIVYATGNAMPFVYIWKLGSAVIGNSATVDSLPGGTYTITILDTNGCSRSSSIVIYEPPQFATAIINKTNANCSGSCDGTAQAVAAGGNYPYSFLWDGTLPGANVSGLCAGTHNLVVTDSIGCQVTASAIITEPNPLLITPDVSDITCTGDCNGMITLLPGPTGGTPYYTYQWTPLLGTGPSIFNLCPDTYIVVVTDIKGCTAIGVSILQEPVLLAADSITIPSTCGMDNGSAAVVPSGGTPPYTYLWPDGQTTAIVNNLEARDPYWVTITDGVGCFTVYPVTVDDIPGPSNIITGGINLLCNNDNSGSATAVVIGGTPPYTYSWPTGQNNDTAAGLPAGAVFVTVTDSSGCTVSGGTVLTQPSPLVPIAIPPDTICYGQTTTIFASFNGGTLPYSYTWITGGFPGTQGPHSVNPLTATSYSVTVADANGCPSGTQTIVIIVNPPLTVSAVSSGNICIGNMATLTATGGGGNNGPYTYNWSNGSPNQSITVSPATNTTYFVTVDDGCSIPASTSVAVDIFPYPEPDFTLSDLAGCAPFTIVITDSSKISTGSIISWNWLVSDGQNSTDTNPSFVFGASGSYSVTLTVTSDMGCDSSLASSNNIIIYDSPDAFFKPVPETTTILFSTIKFFDGSSSDVAGWLWDFGDTASGVNDYDTLQNPIHTYNQLGTFIITLKVTSVQNCIDTYTDSVVIKSDYVLFAPNAFTPDGDGVNDVFMPEGLGIDENNFTLYIFDRWGDLIFTSTDVNRPWNARANDGTETVPQDVYVWIIKTTDPFGNPHKYIGHVAVVK